jgi:hypothetical protein
MERKIDVITTGQSGIIPVYTGASKWSELKTALTKAGVNYNGMKSVVGQTRVTLEHPDATLPEGEFELFLMPEKSNKGGLSRNEIYAAIKDAVEAGVAKKEDFAVDGKNYTVVASPVLERLLAEKGITPAPGQMAAKQAAQPINEPTTNVTTVNGEENYGVRMATRVQELATTAESQLDEACDEDEWDKVNDALDNIREIKDIAAELIDFTQNRSLPDTSEANETPTVESEAAKMAREEQQEVRNAARQKSEEKQREARSLAAGFPDVRNY